MDAENSFVEVPRVLLLLLTLAVVVAPVSQARAAGRADPGVITLATDVRSGPGIKDKVVATVPAGHKVTVLEMKGATARIESKTVKGWVPASKVRIGDGTASKASSGGGGGFFRDMTALLGGNKKSKDVKVTAGARGLTPGALDDARPNPVARRKMESLAASRGKARAFGKRHKLAARKYEYLAASGTSGSGSGFFQGSSGGSSTGATSANSDR